ncbi:MAG: flavin-dependent oxidoreductase [Actinobacteria bacterium]|nr:flavin-dependent oxidoreductase [Actinomycetota bacterium]MDA2995610.1 flavin-dependent oxidoreductase [Actinomycetota bacterium]
MGHEVLVVGGGIAGLATALSLHAEGIDVVVRESVPKVEPLGVGINLLPHAIRELDALGLLDELEQVGVAPTNLAYFSARGQMIWEEARGRAAGYKWPQLSLHRGTLQVTLHHAAVARLGADRVVTGRHLISIDQHAEGATAHFDCRDGSGQQESIDASIVIAADGIHSAVRQQRFPNEGMPLWNGALLWRGAVEYDPILDGNTMVWAGHPDQKFVAYPIRNLENGKQLINFIAEYRTDDRELLEREDWNRAGNLDDFAPRFEEWVFDWLDIPTLLRAAPGTFLFPMVDRDPLDQWTQGRVTLIGDAAHPMYPIGSNGASQGILDARVLAGCIRTHRNDPDRALAIYEAHRRPPTSAIVLANRGLGPEMPMRLVHERAPHGFDSIDDVISQDEILEVTDGYRRTAGFALEALASGKSLIDGNYAELPA